jgi:hypothetical protein
MVKLVRTKQGDKTTLGEGYVECTGCKVRLVFKGGTMLDCARMWNVRAQRRAELAKHSQSTLSLLHSDIATNYAGEKEACLENTEEMWKIARAAELSWDMDATPKRPEEQIIKVKVNILMAYLDALMTEASEKV